MSDVAQGPEWWQASDLKWYPPELHADYVAPLPPPPAATKGQRNVGFVLAGLVLLEIAVPVVWRLFVPGFAPPAVVLLVVAAIAIVGAAIALRSGQSVQRKVGFVLAGLALLAFVGGLFVGVRGLKLLGYLVVVAIMITGVTIAVRSGQPAQRKVMFSIAAVLVAVATSVAGANLGLVLFGGRSLFGGGSSGGGAGSADSSSFCPDFLNLWDGPQGVSSAIMAVQEADAAKEYRAHGWSNTALVTAARNAETLAAEAPSDRLKTDFTNIAQTLSAHAHLDLTYHGTGNEQLDVDGSTIAARCRLHMPAGH